MDEKEFMQELERFKKNPADVELRNGLIEFLHAQLGKRIFAVMFSYCYNPALSLDLTQETFLCALNHLHGITTPHFAGVARWLMTTAYHIALAEFKRRKREMPTESLPEPEIPSTLDCVVAAEETTTQGNQLAQLHWALNHPAAVGLKENELSVLLARLNDLPYHTIAQTLKITECHARAMELKGKRKLQKYFSRPSSR